MGAIVVALEVRHHANFSFIFNHVCLFVIHSNVCSWSNKLFIY